MTEKPPRPHVGRVVRKEIAIDADAARVYEAWADPERIASWFVDRAEGDMRTDDVVTWIFEQFGMRLPVEVFAREDGRYLAFGGEPPGRPAALQEIELRPEGGKTVLRLANSGFGEGDAWDEELAGVDSGWEMALAMLKLSLERYPGRARRHTMVMHPASFEYEALAPRYFTAAGLESWLASDATLGAEPVGPGDRFEVVTRDGPTVSGSVAARSGWEVLIDWPDRSGALTLKGFSVGPQGRMVAAAFDAWDGDDASFAEVERMLEAAIPRLVSALSSPD